VVETGASTQMGQIADMVSATKRSKSPLQQELDGLTKIFGFLAWGAVGVIAIVGLARGQDIETPCCCVCPPPSRRSPPACPPSCS
jgi:Ca2+-transporting ATPase